MSTVGVKIGTKNWSDASPSQITRQSTEKNMTPGDLKKLGGDDIGEVLNKLNDPNWVDPSKKVRAVGSDKMGKDAFMKLMLAQMKNQDPTNPLKSHEMAAQLAQFSSLEQLQNVNDNLGDLKNAQKPTETYQSLNFIGKAVAGDSAKITRLKGDVNHEFTFELPTPVREAKIVVKNEAGEVVRKFELRDLKQGPNSWRWNGTDDRGVALPAGNYRFVTEAKDQFDKNIPVKTDFEGTITGVNYTPEGPVLLIGEQSIKLKDVKRIIDPSLLTEKQKNVQNATLSPLQNQGDVKHTKEVVNEVKGAPDYEDAPVGNVMTSVPMSNDLMAKLVQETKPSN